MKQQYLFILIWKAKILIYKSNFSVRHVGYKVKNKTSDGLLPETLTNYQRHDNGGNVDNNYDESLKQSSIHYSLFIYSLIQSFIYSCFPAFLP